jgi:uncharacterized protein
MEKHLSEKLRSLEKILSTYPSALVAFSGGVDSTFLAYECKKIIGQNTLLVTATSSTYPKSEFESARSLAEQFCLCHKVIVSEELDIPEFSSNPKNRCYYCKKELFSKLLKIANEEGIAVIFDGNNADDSSDYRPGRIAAKELGILSPLELAGLTKNDIRALSREYNLPTYNKPAMACLASRFPYGEAITKEKLSRVEKAEHELFDLGFSQVRVRSHGDLARVEISRNEFQRAFEHIDKITMILKQSGFAYQCLDLQGYRTGSMNEVITI